jgi:SnoaL-like protein
MTESDRIAQLERRLCALEDERAILDTIHRYVHSIDHHTLEEGLDAAWIDCFVEDGVWDIYSRDGDNVSRFAGRAELRAFVDTHQGPPARWLKHFMSATRVDLDGDRAYAESYFLRVDDDPTRGAVIQAFGRYKDVLVRCPDARWRFAERRVELNSANWNAGLPEWEERTNAA